MLINSEKTQATAEVKDMISANPGLEAKTVFEYLKLKHPNEYDDGQLRTLQVGRKGESK